MKIKHLLFSLFLVFFAGCKKEPCEQIICLNGGYCVNGACVCQEGFTGADCSLQKSPTQIRIHSIEITRFPATDNGAGWDLTSGPEIYPEIRLGNSVIWRSNTYYPNANPSNTYTFEPSPAIVLNSPQNQYSIVLYDYDDLDADDFIGGINFIPYFPNNSFPSVLFLDAGGAVAFRLHVSYVW
jgi:hypothetical protein